MFPKSIKPARGFLLWWTRATPRQILVFIKTFIHFVDWNHSWERWKCRSKAWTPYSQNNWSQLQRLWLVRRTCSYVIPELLWEGDLPCPRALTANSPLLTWCCSRRKRTFIKVSIQHGTWSNSVQKGAGAVREVEKDLKVLSVEGGKIRRCAGLIGLYEQGTTPKSLNPIKWLAPIGSFCSLWYFSLLLKVNWRKG